MLDCIFNRKYLKVKKVIDETIDRHVEEEKRLKKDLEKETVLEVRELILDTINKHQDARRSLEHLQNRINKF